MPSPDDRGGDGDDLGEQHAPAPLVVWLIGGLILVLTIVGVVALRARSDDASPTATDAASPTATLTTATDEPAPTGVTAPPTQTAAPAPSTATAVPVATATAAPNPTVEPATSTPVPTALPATPTSTATPPPEPPGPPAGSDILAAVDTIGDVQNDPPEPGFALFTGPVAIAYVETYHWNDGRGATPGTIALLADDGTLYGPWPAVGRTAFGVGNAYWVVHGIDEAIPAGDYQVVDSDPATWSHNAASFGRGVFTIYGYMLAPPVDSSDPGIRAGDLVIGLLETCGVEILETLVDASSVGWVVEARTEFGAAVYLVTDLDGNTNVVPQDPLAADLAIDCGFSTP